MFKNKSNLLTPLMIGIFYLIVLMSFKKVRTLFPPPEISSNKIVGYAQYFGYPLHFDVILFFAITIFTFLYPFIVKKFKKNKKEIKH